MKSLEQRKAFRAKQREENAKKADKEGASFEDASNVNAGEQDILSKSVANIAASLSTLSDDELKELEADEASGKNRTGVNDAIANEKKRRSSNAGGWNKQAG